MGRMRLVVGRRGGAPVEPGDAQQIGAVRPQRNEAVFGQGAVIMRHERRGPVGAVGRAGQGDVIGKRLPAGLLQPMRPDGAIEAGDDMGRVGRVDEHGIADGDRHRRAGPALSGGVPGAVAEGMAPAGLGIDPGQQDGAVVADGKVRGAGAGNGAGQRPVEDLQLAGVGRGRRRGIVRPAAAGKHHQGSHTRQDHPFHGSSVRDRSRWRPRASPLVNG